MRSERQSLSIVAANKLRARRERISDCVQTRYAQFTSRKPGLTYHLPHAEALRRLLARAKSP